MEDEDGYMAIDPNTRSSCPSSPPKETKDTSSSLLWWKIGLGISLAGIAALTVVLIVLSLPSSKVFQASQDYPEKIHPVFFPEDLFDSKNQSMMEHLSKLPKHSSCTTPAASCLPAPSEICINVPKDPLIAVINETVLIPVDIEYPKSDWEFLEIQWHHIKGAPDDFILKLDMRSCIQASKMQKWWHRNCNTFIELMPTHRWRTSVMLNGWLVIWNVQEEDSGKYQITVRSNNMNDACSFVYLSVVRGNGEENITPLLT